MTKNAFEMDIHNMQRRYENAARNLLEHQGIGQENKQKILQFLEYCQAQDLSLARRLFYLQRLTIIAATLGKKSFQDADRVDVEGILSEISGRRGRSGQSLGAWTKRGYKITARVFWRWIRGCEEGEDPQETAWIKIKRTKDVKTLPEDLLTKDDVLKMLRVGESHHKGKRSAIIVMAEGAGDFASVTQAIKEKTGYEVRLTRLGQVQRGGHPSACSRLLACRMGAASVDFLLEGKTRDMTGIQGDHIVAVDLEYASTVDKPIDEQLYRLGLKLST